MSDTPPETAEAPPPGPPVSTEAGGRAIVARLAVKLVDDEVMNAVRRQVDEAAAAHPAVPLVVLDFTPVLIIPSLALGLLVHMAKECKARDQILKLVGVQPRVRQVFSLTRLDRVLQFADSVDAALA